MIQSAPSVIQPYGMSGKPQSIVVSTKIIDGDIQYWINLMQQASMYHSKMRVVATEDGGVKVEFYSSWDFGEPVPKAEMAKIAVKKPWWRIW